MLEKLFPLDLPPGLRNTGTDYQSKGRWSLGNAVRFFQGTIQPVGGWVARTLTGATITGTPNAAISWQTNAGTSYLVIGTTEHLYAVTSDNVVYQIDDNRTTLVAPFQWSLAVFGSYLIATTRTTTELSGSSFTTAVTTSFWTGDVADLCEPLGNMATTSHSAFGVVVTPERFLVQLRGSPPEDATIDPIWID
jgi:hypothetical protein